MRRESAFGLIGLLVTIGVTGAPVITAFPKPSKHAAGSGEDGNLMNTNGKMDT
jgi:hypothetical protein